MELLEQLQRLAKYYRDLLAAVSQRSGKHLIDLGSILHYGLTSDVTHFIKSWTEPLDRDPLVLRIERSSPGAVMEVMRASEKGEEPAEESEEPAEQPKTDRAVASARLVAIDRKQQADKFNRETVIGFPIIAGQYGSKTICAPLFYFTMLAEHDPINSVVRLVRTFQIPALNSHLVATLIGSDEETELVRQRILPILHRGEITAETIEEVVQVLAEMVDGMKGLTCDKRPLAPLDEALKRRGLPGVQLFSCVVAVNAHRTNAFLQDDLIQLAGIQEIKGDTVLGTILSDVPENVGELDDPDIPSDTGPLFFPGVSNKAQRLAARKAERARLMVIQGPPGTGKSQTISNLVCHLVATGKTVLVTSHQNKALEVVEDKLPDVEYLAMSLMKGEKESAEELSNKIEHFESAVHDKTPASLQGLLDMAIEKIKKKQVEIRKLQARFSELKRIERDRFPQYRRYHELAKYNGINRRDVIPQGQEGVIARALGEWHTLATRLYKHHDDLQSLLGSAREVGSASRVVQASQRINTFIESFDQCVGLARGSSVKDILEFSAEETNLDRVLDAARAHLKWLGECGELVIETWRQYEALGATLTLPDVLDASKRWTVESVKALLGRTASLEREARGLIAEQPLSATFPIHPEISTLLAVEESVKTARKSSVSWFKWITFGAISARKNLQRQGFGRFGRREANAFLREVERWTRYWRARQNLRAGLESLKDSGVVVRYLEPQCSLQTLLAECQRSKALLSLFALFVRADHLFRVAILEPTLKRRLLSVTSHERLLTERDLFKKIEVHLACCVTVAELKQDAVIKEAWRNWLLPLTSVILKLQLADQPLAHADHIRVLVALSEAYGHLVDLEVGPLSTLGATRENLLQSIAAGKESEWVQNPDFAVEARRLSEFVDGDLLKDPDDLGEVTEAITREQEALRHLIVLALQRSRFVALKKAESDNATRQQVVKVRQLLRKKRKTPSFVDLRESVDYAKLLSVFPCWIMSIEDVARIFPQVEGLFDYLIVDEASQCNQAAAFHLAFRAKRMIVVGDRKQLKNATMRFMGDDLIRLLLTKNGLDKHPKKDFLHGRLSLLDLCEYCANASQFLNEHFRCEPPIIHWSNKNFYDGKLRIMTPKRVRRFTPSMELRLVAGADDSPEERLNTDEADAVVHEVVRMIESGEAEGLTIGVISPFREQATYVQGKLHEAFEKHPEVLREHDVTASTADGFQGDERDIILYTLRYGPSTHPGTIRAIEIEKERINVAFTRARRKVICFTSKPPAEFPSGLIRSFLEHVVEQQNRAREKEVETEEDVFESEFERVICQLLRERGLTVRTQVPCAGFRIDLVAEDTEGRQLAVECDGEFHYEDDGDLRQEDYQRQDIIERSGWSVHRVPARRFYHNPQAMIERVIGAIKRLPRPEEIGVQELTMITESALAAEEPVALVEPEPVNPRPESPPVRAHVTSPAPVKVQQRELPGLSTHAFQKTSPAVAPTRYDLNSLGDGLIKRSEAWWALSHWGKTTGKLNGYANRFCYDIGVRLKRGGTFTRKQISYAKSLWASAHASGFLADKEEAEQKAMHESKPDPQAP